MTALKCLRKRVILVRTTTESRSEEHTSELQSQSNLVCRLLLEKKKDHIQRLTEHNHARGDTHTQHRPAQPVIKLHHINPKPADATFRINEIANLCCLSVSLNCR